MDLLVNCLFGTLIITLFLFVRQIYQFLRNSKQEQEEWKRSPINKGIIEGKDCRSKTDLDLAMYVVTGFPVNAAETTYFVTVEGQPVELNKQKWDQVEKGDEVVFKKNTEGNIRILD